MVSRASRGARPRPRRKRANRRERKPRCGRTTCRNRGVAALNAAPGFACASWRADLRRGHPLVKSRDPRTFRAWRWLAALQTWSPLPRLPHAAHRGALQTHEYAKAPFVQIWPLHGECAAETIPFPSVCSRKDVQVPDSTEAPASVIIDELEVAHEPSSSSEPPDCYSVCMKDAARTSRIPCYLSADETFWITNCHPHSALIAAF